MMCYRLALYVQFKTEWRPPVNGPIVKGCFADCLNDLRGLTDVIETLAGLLVNVGGRLHPGRMRFDWRKVTRKVFRAFQGFSGAIIFQAVYRTRRSRKRRLQVTRAALTGAAIQWGRR